MDILHADSAYPKDDSYNKAVHGITMGLSNPQLA